MLRRTFNNASNSSCSTRAGRRTAQTFRGGGCHARIPKATPSAASEAVWKTSAMRPPARVPADGGTRWGAIRKAHVLQYLRSGTHGRIAASVP